MMTRSALKRNELELVGIRSFLRQHILALNFQNESYMCPSHLPIPLETFEWNEKDYRAYLNLVPHEKTTISLEYTYERITQDPLFAGDFLDAETHKVPVMLAYFMRTPDLSFRTTVMYVHQSGQFRLDPASFEFVPGNSSFWTADFALTYRLPRRRGTLTAEIRNLLDEDFNFQETDVLNPTMSRERLAFLRASFFFFLVMRTTGL